MEMEMEIILKCKSCEFNGDHYVGSVRNWSDHNKQIHSADEFKCSVCPMLFHTSDLRDYHEEHDHEKILCIECDRNAVKNNYILRSELNAHYNKEHNFCKIECNACGNKFQAQSNLVTHRGVWHHENPEPPQILCSCGDHLKTKRAMHRHTTDRHHDKPHLCSNCCVGFGTKHERAVHSRGCKIKYE